MKQQVIIICATLSLVCLGAWAIQAQTASDAQTPSTTIAGKSVVEPQHIAVEQTNVCRLQYLFHVRW